MLYLTMRFSETRKHDGILLAWSKGQMRIAVDGFTDLVELREMEGRWILDDGTPVELDGLFTDGNTDVALCDELSPRVSAAGHMSGAEVITWSQSHPFPAASVH